MLYFKRHLLKFIPIIVLGYMHSGQAVPKHCQNSFLKKQRVDQMLQLLQSDKSAQDKKPALEFFRRHHVTDFKVHRFLIRLLHRSHSEEELRQVVISVLLERKEILYEIVDYESSRIKKSYFEMLIRQIEKVLYDMLKSNLSKEVLIFLIENEHYEDNHRAQRYLVGLLADSDEGLRQAVKNRLEGVLNAYWNGVFKPKIEQPDFKPSVIGDIFLLLLVREGVYSPLLYKGFSDMLKDHSNGLQLRMTALGFLEIIYSVEISRLRFMNQMADLEPSTRRIKKLLKLGSVVQRRAESAVRSIQKVLMDVIQSESEINHPIIIDSIEFLGRIDFFDHEARVLLEDIRDDKDIYIKIRKSAREALDQMEANGESQHSGTE